MPERGDSNGVVKNTKWFMKQRNNSHFMSALIPILSAVPLAPQLSCLYENLQQILKGFLARGAWMGYLHLLPRDNYVECGYLVLA